MQVILRVNVGIIVAPIFARASAASGLVNPAYIIVGIAQLSQHLPRLAAGRICARHAVVTAPERVLVVRLTAQIIPLGAEGLIVVGHVTILLKSM